jgi:hypothetical protein
MDVAVCAAMAAARGLDPVSATKEAVHAGNVLISIPVPPAMTQCSTLAAEIAQKLEF